MSAGRKSRGTADGLRLKRYADKLAPAFSTVHPPPVLLSRFFARRSDGCFAQPLSALFLVLVTYALDGDDVFVADLLPQFANPVLLQPLFQ